MSEGEAVTISFGRNVRGESVFQRLSLEGVITSEGDDTGNTLFFIVCV